jgi:hypothetical protein
MKASAIDDVATGKLAIAVSRHRKTMTAGRV